MSPDARGAKGNNKPRTDEGKAKHNCVRSFDNVLQTEINIIWKCEFQPCTLDGVYLERNLKIIFVRHHHFRNRAAAQHLIKES